MNLTFKNVFFSFREYVKVCLRLLAKRSLFTVLLYGFIMLLGLLNIISLAASPALRANVLAGDMITPLILLFFTLFIPFAFWQNFRRSYRSSAFLQAPATYILSEYGIQVISPLVNSQAAWPTINKLYLLGNYAVLMNSNLTGYFLDLRCLEAPATEADLIALAHRHNIPVK